MKKEAVKKGVNWKALAVCFLAVIFVAYTGSLFTSRSVNTDWYDSVKPAITPPNYVFPVAWTILFLFIAISVYLAWTSACNDDERKRVVLIYGLNFDLNMLWSFLYFGLRNPAAAFYQIGLLWISIALMIIYTWKINRKASLLLVPYLIWVSFATYLNWLSI